MAWVGFQRDAPDGVQLIGLDDDLLDLSPLRHLPYAYEVIVTARSVAPNDVEITERFIRQLAERAGGAVGATVRARRCLTTLVYLPDDSWTEILRTAPIPARSAITVERRFDPGWEAFEVVRPRGIEHQSMDDFIQIGQLLEAGDSGAPRPLLHRVVGVHPVAAAGLVAAIEQLGVDAELAPGPNGERVITVTHTCAPSDVTPIAWGIHRASERFGAVYDGWRCDLVRARQTVGPRRRGLFRR